MNDSNPSAPGPPDRGPAAGRASPDDRTAAARPVPLPDADSRPYWQAAREGRLRVQRCLACGKGIFYPRSICPACGGDRLEWIDASGRGQVYTYTVVRRAPEPFTAETPYVVALVDLREGVRMLSRVVGCPPEGVRIGMPVRVDFQPVTDEIALPVFRPA